MNLPSWVLAALARGAAAIVAVVVVFLTDKVGVPVSDDQKKALTETVTLFGAALLIFIYGIVRPLISKYIHPRDDSTPVPAISPVNKPKG